MSSRLKTTGYSEMSRRAIVIQGPGEARVSTVPIPEATKDFIRVKTVSVALNPSDWKHIDWRADPGAVVGFDYAGYVDEVGPDVKKGFKKGDRVAGFTHGCKSSTSGRYPSCSSKIEGCGTGGLVARPAK
jgi:NADPH:quinone reductase-like Zn-dependent oxidoreductase